MKFTKLACAAVAATLAFGANANTAKAQATTTDSYALAFALSFSQQQPDTYSGNTETSSYKIMKVTNKDILNFFAQALGTTWPAGAQVVYDNDSEEVVIVDKTGTNILFYCDEDDSLYLDMDPWDYDNGVYSGTYVDATPGSESYNEFYRGYFEIYDDYFDDGIRSKVASPSTFPAYVDIWGYGLTQDSYSDKWNSKTDSGSETFTFLPITSGYTDNTDYNMITGSIFGTESWSGPAESIVKHAKTHKH